MPVGANGSYLDSGLGRLGMQCCLPAIELGGKGRVGDYGLSRLGDHAQGLSLQFEVSLEPVVGALRFDAGDYETTTLQDVGDSCGR